jgi:uncharacterized alkaline shock family protein YloU
MSQSANQATQRADMGQSRTGEPRQASHVSTRPESPHGDTHGRQSGPGVALSSESGTTRISDGVVAKIAGLAARDVPGVHSMGSGVSRRVGQLRSFLPGTTKVSGATQGVSVEVGEREAAIDLDLVTWYGQSIVDITEAVRNTVIGQVEGMTGLKVVEVNIQVADIHVEGDDGQGEQGSSGRGRSGRGQSSQG